MGGGTNLEQLFAAASAACFHGALNLRETRSDIAVRGSSVQVPLASGRDPIDGLYLLALDVGIRLPGIEKSLADDRVQRTEPNLSLREDGGTESPASSRWRRRDRVDMNAQARASKISVAIRHQDMYVAAGICALLRSRDDFAVYVGDPDDLAANVFVCDYAAGLHRATATARHGHRNASSCLIVTDQDRGVQIRRAVDVGIRGYVLQDCSADELSEAVRCVAAGRRYLSVLVADQLLDSLTLAVPTARELEVLQLVARGLTNKGIGSSLGIGEGTVKTHVKAILGKLGESTRTAAVLEARRRGLLSEERPSDSTSARRARIRKA